MNILRGERDQAKDIIDDLQKKLAVVTAVLNDYDLERQVRTCYVHVSSVGHIRNLQPGARGVTGCAQQPRVVLFDAAGLGDANGQPGQAQLLS